MPRTRSATVSDIKSQGKPVTKRNSTPDLEAMSKATRTQSNAASDTHDVFSINGGTTSGVGTGASSSRRGRRGGGEEDEEAANSSITLNKSLSQLQKEADQQLELELETQMTLEHFMGQMISLKNAFAMLSDVVMHEVDAARSEARRRIDVCNTTVATNNQNVETLQQNFALLMNRLGEVEDRQSSVISELKALRQQGDQTQSWLSSVSEQLTGLKATVGEISNKQNTSTSEVAKECSELKRHVDNQSHSIISRVNECGTEISKQRAELTTSNEQRMDDLELLEKALSTLQAQQVRLRSGVDETVAPLQMELRSLKSKTEGLEAR